MGLLRLPPVWGMRRLKNEISLGLPQDRWVWGDRLGIGRCEVGPGGSLTLTSPKLQKRASDPEAYLGVDQN